MVYLCQARPKPGGNLGGRRCNAGTPCTLQVLEGLAQKKPLPWDHTTTRGPFTKHSPQRTLDAVPSS